MSDAATDGSGSAGEPDVLAESAGELLRVAEQALPGWVRRSVHDRWDAYRAVAGPEQAGDEPVTAAAEAGAAAVDDVIPALRDLLALDVEAQWTGPLAILRRAVAYPTAVLQAAGVPPVVRDAFAERTFPDDLYDLSPGGFADLDPDLHEPGLIWGAAKAHTVLRRRKGQG